MNLRILATRRSLVVVRIGVAVCLLAAGISCGGDNAPAQPTAPSAPVPRSLTVVLVAVDSGYQAAAVVAFSEGSSRDVTTEVQWSSSEPNVAVVSESGRVTPVAPGTTEIRGSYQTVSASAHLTVAAPPPSAAPQPPPSPSPAPQPGPQNRRIFGRVRDALDQAFVAEAAITVTSQGQTVARAQSDRDGLYSVSTALAGNVTISAALTGYTARSIEQVITGDTEVDFTLQPTPFTLSGTIGDANDREDLWCEPARVEVLDGANAGRSIVVWRNANSSTPRRFEIANMQPGTVRFRASAPDYHTRELAARVRGNAPIEILLGRFPNSDARPRCGRIEIGGPAKEVSVGDVARPVRLTFDARAGQPITIRVTENTIGTVNIELLRPDLARLTAMSGAAAFNVSAPSLPSTGTYTILLTLVTAAPANQETARMFRMRVTSP